MKNELFKELSWRIKPKTGEEKDSLNNITFFSKIYQHYYFAIKCKLGISLFNKMFTILSLFIHVKFVSSVKSLHFQDVYITNQWLFLTITCN